MSCYIRLRGLPWSVTHLEILDFLKNINVVNGTKGIHMVLSRWDGKNTGEAFVELASLYDEKEAFKLNKMTLGHRYIEIFSATKEEVQHALKNPGSISSNVVKLRGLPYAITEDMIDEFFNGLNIKRSREGTVIVMDRRGRATGEAYVQFESLDDTEQALLRNREKIGHRYIEIFRSSLAEMRRQSGSRPGPYDIKDRGALRNRDDFGNTNMASNGDSGLFVNNKNGFVDVISKPIALSSSGNGLIQNGFGIQGGFRNDGCDNKFGRSMHNNNMGMGINSNIGCNNSEKFFNSGLIWNNDINRNTRGSNAENGQNFDNIGFNYDNDGNKLNNIYENGNNGAVNVVSLMGNKTDSEQPMNIFGINRNFRFDDDQYCIHMRGLPYNTFEKDVVKFFAPIRPSNVQIIFNNKGLHSGTADAYFNSYEDSQNAMKKHMEQIGSRYIELFFDGKTKSNKCSFGRQNQM